MSSVGLKRDNLDLPTCGQPTLVAVHLKSKGSEDGPKKRSFGTFGIRGCGGGSGLDRLTV